MPKLDHLFSLDYHPKLFHILLSFTLLGLFSANLLGPGLMAYIIYDVIPHSYIYIWLFMHFLVLSLRLGISVSFKKNLGKNKEIRIQYLKKTIILFGITTTLYALAIWGSFFYHASDLQIFTLSIIMIALAAGALATLISIYHLYLLFVLGMMTPLITMFVYHGGEMFNIFAIVLSIFTLSTVSAGYKQYQALKNTISLEETFQTIFDKSSDGIILIQNNRFKDCNTSVVKMFQYDSKTEILNTHLSKFMPEKQPDGMNSIKKMFQTLLEISLYSSTRFTFCLPLFQPSNKHLRL
ncbi:MAG: PAS domain-containing protein [Epsilonproteobacteria bacterium]|nr:PAS domain-containing protein [Campylobacterota bacterium]